MNKALLPFAILAVLLLPIVVAFDYEPVITINKTLQTICNFTNHSYTKQINYYEEIVPDFINVSDYRMLFKAGNELSLYINELNNDNLTYNFSFDVEDGFIIADMDSNLILPVNVTLRLQNKTYNFKAIEGKFIIPFTLPENISMIQNGTLKLNLSYTVNNITNYSILEYKKNTTPIVTEIYGHQVVAGQPYEIKFFVDDKFGLKNVSAEYNKSYISSLVNLIKNDEFVSYSVMFSRYGDTCINFSFIDYFDNVAEKQLCFAIEPRDYLIFKHQIELPMVLLGKTYRFKIYDGKFVAVNFSIANASIELANSTNNTKPPMVWIDNGQSNFELTETPKTISGKEFYLNFIGYAKSNVTLNIKLSYDKSYKGTDNVIFKTVVGNYELLPKMNLTIGGRKVVCELNLNQDDFDKSTYECKTVFPIYTDLKDVGMVITKREMSLYEKYAFAEADKYKSMYTKTSRWLKVCVIILVILVLAIIISKLPIPHIKW